MDLSDLAPMDTETGGVDAAKDPLLSVAAWHYDGDSFLRYVRPEPGQFVHPDAARVNGYTYELWAARGAVSLKEAMTDLRAWLLARKAKAGNRWKLVPLAHNATFDRQFIEAAEKRSGVRVMDLLDYRWECSMTLFSALMRAGIVPRGKATLDRLSECAGLPRAAVHDALEDARNCALGYQWAMTQMLTGGHATGGKLIQAQGSQLQAAELAIEKLLPLCIDALGPEHVPDGMRHEIVAYAAAVLGTTPEAITANWKANFNAPVEP